jgi:lipopolysaccharide biosynthesis protein
MSSTENSIRPIAIYLPQYHPIPENDAWWGKGFTEWTNVTRAKPLFEGHYQPHLPADLGFYDLRVAEVREEQARLAKEHGIYGFCYYHYWFNGRRILERPFQEVFESGKPDFPFMLCWANENWSRAWEGKDDDVLLEQQYSEEDDRAHINYLVQYFLDERYIRVNGKPVINIYNSTAIPNVKSTIKVWREEAAKQGLELYICRFESFDRFGKHYLEDGFDAAIDFQPFGGIMHAFKKHKIQAMQIGLVKKARYTYYKKVAKRFFPKAYHKFWNEDRRRLDYNEYAEFAMQQSFPSYKWYPGVTPMWDNTARKKHRSFLLHNSTPTAYYNWLRSIIKKFKPHSTEENFIFINAWNEWAEGNHLEPDQKWGRSYLEQTKKAVNDHQLQLSEQWISAVEK